MEEPHKIAAPVAMPRAVRIIATLLIGVPGYLLWTVGLFATMMCTAGLFTNPPSERPAGLAFFGMSVAAIFFGYSMVAATSWLNGSHPYRIPGRRLAAYVAMEILDLLLVSISVGLFIVFAISLASGRPAFPWLWLFSSAAGFALAVLAMRVRKRFGKAWRDELLSGPEGAKPLY